MSVEIKRVGPASPPPTAVGALIVQETAPGHCEARFIRREGPVRVYSSSLGGRDNFQHAIDWAISWAAHRRIERIYVMVDADAELAPAG